MFRPFRAGFRFCRVPRALPWACTSCPVGAGNVVTGEAPTGHNLIAQGNALEMITQGIALGMRRIKPSNPERATSFAGLQAVAYVPPLQGGDSFLPCSQGIALGMRPIKSSSPERATPFAGLPTVAYVPPLQGGGSFLSCSQDIALGMRPIKSSSPERATSFAGLLTVAYVLPFQGGDSFCRVPRALPWVCAP